MQDGLLETQTVVLGTRDALGAADLQSSEVTVIREGEALATLGFTPTAKESIEDKRGGRKAKGRKKDPPPVSGYAAASSERTRERKGRGRLKEAPNGRFVRPRVIIGPDDRQRVGSTTGWPWRVQGHLIIRFPNGAEYIGSGTLVNRRHVLTAGHCVYSKEDGGWAKSIAFQAARNDATLPYGTAYAVRLLSVAGYTNDNNRDCDMGMLILEASLGSQVGWFGVITGPDFILQGYRVNISGYPGDKADGSQLWTMADVIKAVASERIAYDIDTVGGQSGSGVWSTWTGHEGEKVAAIHTTGSSSGNGATRISRAKFDRIVDWMGSY